MATNKNRSAPALDPITRAIWPALLVEVMPESLCQ